MATAALVVAAEGTSISAVAATPGSVVWFHRYNGPGNDEDQARAVAVSPDGSTVFVTGHIYHFATGFDYGTVAYDASTGVVRWTKRYHGPDNFASTTDEANAVAVSPDGSTVFVTGASSSATRRDYATVAYDASNGAIVWAKRYNGPADGDDEAYALGVGPKGANVFVTGYSYGSSGSRDYATVAYAVSSGVRSWVKRYDAANDNDTATTLAISPDGSSVFVSGYSVTPSTSLDFATVAYGTGTGVEHWLKRYNGPLNEEDAARSVGVSPDSSTVFVTGFASRGPTEDDYATIAYDASNGAKLWSKLYNGPGNFVDAATALAVSPDGSTVFVTGQSSGRMGYDYATVAYGASTGAQRWVSRYIHESSNEAKDVAVSPDGSTIIVTGVSYSSTQDDYATIAYRASTGAKLWGKRFDGQDNSRDVPNALDVSASTVFVTGYTYQYSSDYDYATIAYALA